jgi:hypothetical protein
MAYSRLSLCCRPRLCDVTGIKRRGQDVFCAMRHANLPGANETGFETFQILVVTDFLIGCEWEFEPFSLDLRKQLAVEI